ncbi:hypothetical protein [Microbacterium sp. NPDC056569]|uniref:hypothetical protein n=1 Tax=Microbacterium sp. NPDC056569 TaxID=3345867 RepID=UPI00366F156C
MRWPWQRGEATAAADAAPPVPPAGWAFFPPLQRQLADAVPVTLRPTFVSSLATRTVPTSLGTMGHLVDGAAPAGAIGVDASALGPVQRVVAVELGLRHPPDGAPVAHVDEEVEDAAAPAQTAETRHAASGAQAASGAGTAPDADAEIQAFTEPEPGSGSSSPAEPGSGSSPPVETGLVGEAGRSGASPTLGEPRPSSRPAAPAQRRAGLGAPLGLETVQRRTAGADPARSSPVHGAEITPRRADSPPPAETPPAPAPVSATPPETSAETPPTALPLTAQLAPAADAGSPGRAVGVPPPPTEAPAVRPILQRAEGGIRPSASPAQIGRRESDPRASVQRQAGLGAPLASAVTQHAPAPAPIIAEADAPADQKAILEADAETSAIASPGAEPLRPSAPPLPLRSVPLVAARAIAPSLDASPLGPAHDTGRRGNVVVARAIRPDAPVQPGTADTSASPRTGAPTAGQWTRAHSPSAGGVPRSPASASAAADAPAAIADIAPMDGRLRPQPAVAASVSRSTHPVTPAGAFSTVTVERPHLATPTVQRAFGLPSLPSAPRIPSTPQIGSMPDLASLPGLSSLPDRPDIPSADELRERAGDAAPELAERVPGGAEAMRAASDTLTRAGQTLAPDGGAAGSTAAGSENVEQLVRRLYVPLVRRIKAELLLDRERRGIRIDGI